MTNTRKLQGLICAGLLLAVAAASQAAQWQLSQCTHRRQVTVIGHKPTRLAGEDIAVVSMPTGGLIKDDGSDIRVLTPEGKERPVRVLMVGPGDQVRLAFSIQQGIAKYYVYFNASKPLKPAKPLEIRRGLLQETWAFERGGMKSLDDARKILQKPGKLLGRDFRENIFQGFNPFGPENRIATVFTGYLNCTRTGTYTFASSSRDASFLLVDDQLVVDHGGGHEPAGDIRANGKVDLKAGLRKITYYHICAHGDPVCVAAWKPPGSDKVWTIDAKDFAPVFQVDVGPIERYGRDMEIDFFPEFAGESFVNNRYYERLAFRAKASGNAPRKITWTWDFGDGQTLTTQDEQVQHVYLEHREYLVTLAAKGPRGELTRTNRIFVSRPWGRVAINELDAPRVQAALVGEYDFSKLSETALQEAVNLFGRAERPDLLTTAAESLLARDKAPAGVIDEVLPAYLEAMVAQGKGEQAAASLVKAAGMSDSPATKATMTVLAGKQLLIAGGKGNQQKALDLFETVLKKYQGATTVAAIRQAQIGVGDVWRARLDYDKAKAAYAAAKTGNANVEINEQVARGDYSRHVEEYLRKGELTDAHEYLDRWEEAFPLDKLQGFSTLLRCRLYMAQARHQAAVDEAQTLAGVNPTSNYAAQLLMLQVQAHEKLGQDQQAKATLLRVAKNYKETPLAAEAMRRLALTSLPKE